MHNYLSPLLSNKKVIYVSAYIEKLFEGDVDMKDINYRDLLYTKDPNNIEVRRVKTLFERHNKKKINELIDQIIIYISKLDKKIFTGYKPSVKSDLHYDFIKILHAIKLIKLKDKVDLYFSAAKVKETIYINTPYRDSFDQYDQLYEKVKPYCIDDNILTFGCGPVGKVMILEFKKSGVKNLCFDFGQNIL